jgi:hypothetical protein
MQPLTELGVDLRVTPHVFGLPRYMYGSALRDVRGCALYAIRGRAAEAFRHEMMLAFFAGYVRARWSELSAPRTRSAPAGGRWA